MSENTHIYQVDALPGSTFRLIVRGVDWALRVYNTTDEMVSVNNTTLSQFQQNDEHPLLELRRKYLIRYNNNNGSNGNLNLSIVQYYPNNTNPVIVRNFDLTDIMGPQVIEIPFMLVPS
jgi:hypothetical protein